MQIINLKKFNSQHQEIKVNFSASDYTLSSGTSLKKFRRKLFVESAYLQEKKQSEQTKTYKFPLEIPEEFISKNEDLYHHFLHDYNQIAGNCAGSMFELWARLLLSQFRIHENAATAESSYFDKTIDERYAQKLAQFFGRENAALHPSKIIKVFSATPRAIAVNEENIANQIQKKLALKNDDKHPKEQDFIKSLTETLSKQVKQGKWSDIFCKKEDKGGLLQSLDAIDAYFVEQGLNLGIKLATLATSNDQNKSDSVISFDPTLPKREYNADCALYTLVSLALSKSPDNDLLAKQFQSIDEKHIDKLKKNLSSFINTRLITSQQVNGFSWLFGKGLTSIKHFKEGTLSAEQLQQVFKIPPAGLQALLKVIDAMGQFPKFEAILFHPQDFRKQLGAFISGWGAIFLERLFEILVALRARSAQLELPAIFLEHVDETEEILALNSLSIKEINDAIEVYEDSKRQAESALKILLGIEPGKFASDKEVAIVEHFRECSSLVEGLYHTLRNTLKNIKNSDITQFKNNKLIQVYPNSSDEADVIWHEWKNVFDKKIKKINSYKLTKSDLFVDISAQMSRRQVLQEALTSCLLQLNAHYDLTKLGSLVEDDDGTKLRKILWSLVKVVQRQDDVVAKQFKEWFCHCNILREEDRITGQEVDFATAGTDVIHGEDGRYYVRTNAHKLLFSAKGTLYLSPFSSDKRKPFALSTWAMTHRSEILISLNSFMQNLESGTLDNVAVVTAFKLKLIWEMFKCSLLPEDVSLADIFALVNKVNLSLTNPLQWLEKQAKSLAANKILNSFFSELNPLLAQGLNSKLFINLCIKPIYADIFYVPKPGKPTWAISEPLKKSLRSPELQNALAQAQCKNGLIDIAVLLNLLSSLKISKEYAHELASLLAHMPHDWCFDPKIKSLSQKYAKHPTYSSDVIVRVRGKEQPKLIKPKKEALFRFIGNAYYKEQLDQLLLGKYSLSELQILLSAYVDLASNSVSDIKLQACLPLKDKPIVLEKEPRPFDNIIGIDQGEFGLAFTVMPINYLQLPEQERSYYSGYVRINSIRALIKDVKHYRKNQRPVKFTQSAMSTRFNQRKNVIGDVCGVIAALMEKYNAFPILEKTVSNLESGSKALQNVYKAVNSFFLLDGVKFHNIARQNFWGGDIKFEDSRYNVQVDVKSAFKDAKKKENVLKPLAFYPGFGVLASGTSRICHVCGPNVFDLLRQAQEQHLNLVLQDGMLDLLGHKIALYTADESTKTKTSHALMQKKAKDRTYNLRKSQDYKELENLIKRNLRRSPRYLNVKDSQQSRYFCVFTDCPSFGKEQHADINASYNIAMRFLKKLALSAPKDKKDVA